MSSAAHIYVGQDVFLDIVFNINQTVEA